MVKSSTLLLIPFFLIISLLFLRTPDPKRLTSGPVIESLPSSICNRFNYPPHWQLHSDQLTVLINGFSESRLPLLQKISRSYSSFPCVHSVFILWGNTSTPSTLLETLNIESLGAPIYILRNPSSSLNDRFLPRDFISTRAVLICDDDVEIRDSASLSFALRVWSQHGGKRIVGFFGRSHGFELETRSWIYTVYPDRYSIILTKLMIIGTEFLYTYTCHSPKGVREFVNNARNCEDIAMNFIVTDRTGAGPVLVEGSPRDWGDTRNSEGDLVVDAALSSLEDHRKRRGGCITEFHKLWGRMPLRYSYGVVGQRVREQGRCEKFGVLVRCDQDAISNTGRP